MQLSRPLWLGYERGAGRFTSDLCARGTRTIALGSKAPEIAALLSFAAKEAGAKPCVLDIEGSVANSLSGYFDTYDYRSFLYDAFRLDESEAWHSQLAAGAYSLALDLTSEEEAIINSAAQRVASEGTLLSPLSIYDVMGKVEGFRGFYVDKLKGKIGSLRFFDAVDDLSLSTLKGDSIVDFQGAPYPQAAELAALLFIAKLLALSRSGSSTNMFLIVSAANRLFRSSPRPNHTNRLLTHLLEGPTSLAFTTSLPEGVHSSLVSACQVRLHSSDSWNPSGPKAVVSSTVLLQDFRTGMTEPFVPRRVQSKTGEYVAATPSKFPSPEVSRSVLEQVEAFPMSTPESVVQYLAGDFLPSDLNAAISSLQTRGCLVLEPKESGPSPKIFCLTVTEEGRRLLRELSS